MKRLLLNGEDLSLNITRSISQAIKRERLQKNLTLESMAKGICSLSYLSKIENFTIIPHESYLEALCERLDIDFKKILESQKRNDVNEIIKFYLYEMYDNIEEVYLSLDNPYYNVNDGLIKIVYHLYKGNYSEAKKEIQYVHEVKNTLISNEANILTLLVAEYYLKTNQFKKIEEKIDLLIQISKNDSVFQYLYYEQIFIASYHLNINHLMYLYYNLLNNVSLNGYPSWRLFKIHLMMLEVKSREKNCFSFEQLMNVQLNNQTITSPEKLRYYEAIININKGKYEDAFNILYANENPCSRDIALILYCGYKADLVSKEDLIAMAENCQYNRYDQAHKNFINFMVLKLKGINRTELSEVIKYHMLPTNDLSPFPIYSRIYFFELLKLGMRNGHFKLLNKYFF